MAKIVDIIKELDSMAPVRLAEEWDNVGLLVGNESRDVRSVMSCLTLTEDVADEAIKEGVGLIVTHHPLPFRGLKRITSRTSEGRILLKLIEAQVAVYSAHSAYDSASGGINEQYCAAFDTTKVEPLVPSEMDPTLGSGRIAWFTKSMKVEEVVDKLKSLTGAERLKYIGQPGKKIESIAFACGSAGEYFFKAQHKRADLFVTGETNFHTCLAANVSSTKMILLSHFYSEKFATDRMAESLDALIDGVRVFSSAVDVDPVSYL